MTNEERYNGEKEKKAQDGVSLLPDAGGESDPGAAGEEVAAELWEGYRLSSFP